MSEKLMTVDEFVKQFKEADHTAKVAEPVVEKPKPEFDPTTWAKGLERAFLECRAMGHRWEALSARWDKASQSYYVEHECERCETRKHAYWSRVGEPLTTTYSYPDGYLTKPGTASSVDQAGRNVLRKEYVSRVFHLNNL